ncbi:hypothetical protein EHQ92_18035 [Leptospira biflexa]|uniref:hypothetical protein n=1 Tax=Leptospira biflexa TaxID=172 RepID=UPI001090E365|nr:hypothetical protein [Leptospira biflexa]TGM41698.1 hypothetical protein EHQ92_18035 [Leptospira biflexa]TGM43889.1 hypothetical protein EHQ88_18125 [Leptospira biflexa]
MNSQIIEELDHFIRTSIVIDYSDEKTIARLKGEYCEEFFDFSDHFQSELKKEKYAEFLQNFDKYAPLVFEKYKIKPESTSWTDPNFSRIFYYFSQIIPDNEINLDLCRVFFYSINSLSAHLNPGDCNYTIEDLAKRGKLHMILKYCEDALIYLWENDANYFYDRLEEHFSFCKENFRENIDAFKGTELYQNWLEDRNHE